MNGSPDKQASGKAHRPAPIVYAIAGLVIGFALIHPATMLMNHQMGEMPHDPEGWSLTAIEAIRGSFTTARGWVWGSGYALLCALIGFLIGRLRNRERALSSANAELAAEKERSDALILNILPQNVADELKLSGKSEPRKFEDVTILFSDIVGFSRIAARIPPETVIRELNDLFTGFDNIMERNGCDRIKTIGDAYLAVCGMRTQDSDHASSIVRSALEMIEFLNARNRTADLTWKVRIGIHSGDIVGGVVGVKKYIYDVFGDTINCTARLEQHCAPMRINVSETTLKQLANAFSYEERGFVETKEGRMLRMHYVGPRVEQADGHEPRRAA